MLTDSMTLSRDCLDDDQMLGDSLHYSVINPFSVAYVHNSTGTSSYTFMLLNKCRRM